MGEASDGTVEGSLSSTVGGVGRFNSHSTAHATLLAATNRDAGFTRGMCKRPGIISGESTMSDAKVKSLRTTMRGNPRMAKQTETSIQRTSRRATRANG